MHRFLNPIWCLLLALLAACGPDPIEAPTWAADIKPILAANCVRCHGFPNTGGAPNSFRLDVYEDTETDDGRYIAGAGLMSQYISDTTAAESMPPRLPLGGHHIDTLANWIALAPTGDVAPKGAPRPGNRAPTILLLETTDVDATGIASNRYEIRDPDKESVYGELLLGANAEAAEVIARNLHAGRGTFSFNTNRFASGDYTLFARLDDGSVNEITALGAFPINHTGNIAPVARVISPTWLDNLGDARSPFAVIVDIIDHDLGDALTLTLTARAAGQDEVVVADAVAANRGENEISWDTTGVPAGDSWRLLVEVSDGTTTTTAVSGIFSVSH